MRKALQEELKDFQRKVSAAGGGDYNARTGAHDDLVLAIAIRCGRRRQACNEHRAVSLV